VWRGRPEGAAHDQEHGGESAEAWRSILIKRRLRRPEFLIINGAHGSTDIASIRDGVPVQRCTVHKRKNLFAHASERLQDGIIATTT
jgi:putative transposase